MRRLSVHSIRKYAGSMLVMASGFMTLGAQVPVSFDAAGFKCIANIRLNGHSATEVLSNFPVLLQFNTNLPGFSYSQFLSPEAADLRFVFGETNELYYELDTWNPSGDSCFWVQIPGFGSADTLITAYWGRSGMARPAYTTTPLADEPRLLLETLMGCGKDVGKE